MSGLRARFAFTSVSELLGKLSLHGPKQAKILKGWTLELGHYQLAKKACDDGAPPEELFMAITSVIAGISKIEAEVKAGHGDFQATANWEGLGRIMELVPPYAMCQAAERGELVKPGVPAVAAD